MSDIPNFYAWATQQRGGVTEKNFSHDQSTHGGGKLPPPKVMAGHEVTDSFANKKGTAPYTLQKPITPIEGSDRGWVVVKTTRHDTSKRPVHFLEIQGKHDEVVKEFEALKRWQA